MTKNQALEKLHRAQDNIVRFGIIDMDPMRSPDVRTKYKYSNYITVIPNTPENLSIIRKYYPHNIKLYGRGPRDVKLYRKLGYSVFVHEYPLPLDPPYIAVYRKSVI